MKKIRNIASIIGLIVFSFALYGQNNQEKPDDSGRIVLASVVPDQIEGITPAAQSNLTNKLNQITSKNGMGGVSLTNRFIITANVVVLTKDITSTAPPMHAYTLEVTLYIGDGIDGILFSSTSVTLKGVGETETKAYMAALKNLKSDAPDYKSFIEQGKNKIIEYYNSKCDFILKEAESLSSQNQFDAAILKLVDVPQVCKECYDKAMDKAVVIHKQKLEHECQQNISKANAAIAQDKWEEAAGFLDTITPDLDCYKQAAAIVKKIEDHLCSVYLGKAKAAWASRNATEAAGYLGNVSSDSQCAAEARKLGQQIASSLDAKQKREWDLAYEKYNRKQVMSEKKLEADISNEQKRLDANINMENRQMNYKEKQGFELEKARIEQARAVGIAYGKNQPKKVTYNIRGWW
jgi:hypothetical protein